VMLYDKLRKLHKLETVSIAEPLQNWQHVPTPYLGQIWHATAGQWSVLTGLIFHQDQCTVTPMRV